jgi:hypothetical protein
VRLLLRRIQSIMHVFEELEAQQKSLDFFRERERRKKKEARTICNYIPQVLGKHEEVCKHCKVQTLQTPPMHNTSAKTSRRSCKNTSPSKNPSQKSSQVKTAKNARTAHLKNCKFNQSRLPPSSDSPSCVIHLLKSTFCNGFVKPSAAISAVGILMKHTKPS